MASFPRPIFTHLLFFTNGNIGYFQNDEFLAGLSIDLEQPLELDFDDEKLTAELEKFTRELELLSC